MMLATSGSAQATNTPLTFGQEITVLLVAMLTSKGRLRCHRRGLRDAGRDTDDYLDIPIQALAILVGIDKFMSECRALTNLIGNGVAIVVISRWEREPDRDEPNAAMVIRSTPAKRSSTRRSDVRRHNPLRPIDDRADRVHAAPTSRALL